MRKAIKGAGKIRAANREFTALWRTLVLMNLFITLFGFWMIYSQNEYTMRLIATRLPVAIPAQYHHTAVVVNPLTGRFIFVNTFTTLALFGVLLAVLVLAVLFAHKIKV